MLKTSNYNLNKLETNDIVDFDVLNENADILDSELKKVSNKANYIQIAAGSATAITLNDVTLANGFTTTFVVAANNNGAATTINGKALYKPGGAAAPKLIAGRAVTVWYNGTNFFIKASASGNATADKVLAPYTVSTDEDVDIVGTMPDIGPESAETTNLTNQNQEYIIAKGFHSGLRKIKVVISGLAANVIKAGTTVGGIVGTFTADATAIAEYMLSGVVAYVNGNKVTGSIPVVNPDYSDQIGSGVVSVGAYTGDGANYAYMQTGLNGKYSNGVNYVRHYEPYLRPEFIVPGASIMGIPGAAVMGKKFQSGMTTPSAYTTFKALNNANITLWAHTVSGLTFLPSLIIIIGSLMVGTEKYERITIYKVVDGDGTSKKSFRLADFADRTIGTSNMSVNPDIAPAYVNGSGFCAPVNVDTPCYWYAFE